MVCETCEGWGVSVCDMCEGVGHDWWGDSCEYCDDGDVVCVVCKGTKERQGSQEEGR